MSLRETYKLFTRAQSDKSLKPNFSDGVDGKREIDSDINDIWIRKLVSLEMEY